MERFKTFTGKVAALDRANVDTDQILPKQFLRLTARSGFGRFLFYDHRYQEDGRLDPDFALNQPRYAKATILLGRENFGCGSSREHAPWALLDYGFRVLVAPSFAAIFKINCFKNGIPAIELPAEVVDEWFRRVGADAGYTMTVDLDHQRLTGSDGFVCRFDLDPFFKRCLLEGLDEISMTQQHEENIRAYERSHQEPWHVPATKTEVTRR